MVPRRLCSKIMPRLMSPCQFSCAIDHSRCWVLLVGVVSSCPYKPIRHNPPPSIAIGAANDEHFAALESVTNVLKPLLQITASGVKGVFVWPLHNMGEAFYLELKMRLSNALH